MVNLLKSYENIHVMTYRFKIVLSDIVIMNTGYLDNTNDYYLKLKGIAKINLELYHFIFVPKPECK